MTFVDLKPMSQYIGNPSNRPNLCLRKYVLLNAKGRQIVYWFDNILAYIQSFYKTFLSTIFFIHCIPPWLDEWEMTYNQLPRQFMWMKYNLFWLQSCSKGNVSWNQIYNCNRHKGSQQLFGTWSHMLIIFIQWRPHNWISSLEKVCSHSITSLASTFANRQVDA